MSDTPRTAALLAQVARGLVRHGREETARTLGDRRTYIGLSDMGRAITCLRAAVLNKPAETLQRQLVLQRGHWLEAGLVPAFRANGATLMSQLEISITPGDVPIRAHLDHTPVLDADRFPDLNDDDFPPDLPMEPASTLDSLGLW